MTGDTQATTTAAQEDELVLGVGPEEDVADGTYEAMLENLERFRTEVDGEDRELGRWTFFVNGPDGPVAVEGISSKSRSPRGKAVQWMQAILGQKPAPGSNVKRSDLVGKACLAEVAHKPDGWPYIAQVMAAPATKTK